MAAATSGGGGASSQSAASGCAVLSLQPLGLGGMSGLRRSLGAVLLLSATVGLALALARLSPSRPSPRAQPLPRSQPWASPAAAHRPALSPTEVPLDPARDAELFRQLQTGDRAWLPRAVPMSDGSTRYIYRRLPGDPPLSLAQIQTLIRHPPAFSLERQAIVTLLGQLRANGVRVVLGPPRQSGAAGEWDPARGVLRIRPDVPAKGSHAFALVLNHEAIHVAQSCRSGGLRARPMPLGLSRQLAPRDRASLMAPLYARASAQERLLEAEAYANQQRLSLGWQLLRQHCRR